MTTYNKTTLKTFFETGDVPTGANYADLIDSQINIVETAVQVMGGALSTTELITTRVSATDVNITGTLTFGGAFSAGTVVANSVTTSAFVTTNVSASGTVYASAASFMNGVINGVGIVSAAGTTQGAAAILTNVVNRGKGVADGVTTGFAPMANKAGLVQYLYKEGASANLWPPVGGTINGLAVNTAFPLATSAMVTIVHLTASAMAVK